MPRRYSTSGIILQLGRECNMGFPCKEHYRLRQGGARGEFGEAHNSGPAWASSGLGADRALSQETPGRALCVGADDKGKCPRAGM